MNMLPGRPPKTTQNRPKSLPIRNFFILKFQLVFGAIFLQFWIQKGSPLGTLLATKSDQKTDSMLTLC